MPLAQWIRALIAIILIALTSCFGLTVQAQDVQAIPPLTARVMDTSGTLDAVQTQALEAKLAAFEKARGAQIVILMVPTTLPEDITDYAQRVGDAWKIGRKDIGDGLLLVVAKNDRTVRIATTKTLEGAIPDLAAKQIITNAITPRFRQGDFAGGLNAAADQIMARISGENLPAPAEASKNSMHKKIVGFDWGDFAIFLFIAVPIAASILRKMIGRKPAAILVGVGIATLAFLITRGITISIVAGAVAVIISLINTVSNTIDAFNRGYSGAAHPPGSSGNSSTAGGRGLGGLFGGGGFGGGGGFSSGGGGNFGGGGASGNW